MTFTEYGALFAQRAEWLALLIALALVAGEGAVFLTGRGFVPAYFHRLAQFFARKLDRPKRRIATRVYRGMVALLLMLLPVLALGLGFSTLPFFETLGALILLACFGDAFASFRLLKCWRAARANTLPLELPGLGYLFADRHAVLRFLVADSAERFAVQILGVTCWYVLGGLVMALFYLALASLARVWGTPLFGWAAQALFRLLDALPRIIACLLLWVASLLVPRTRPFKALSAGGFRAFLSTLLGISLGGPMPQGPTPWVGEGTPRLMSEHLGRWLLVRLAATVLLLLTLAAPSLVALR